MESQITNNAIARIILSIDSRINNCSKISKVIKMGYPNLCNLMKKIEDSGLINKERKGVIKIITLTDKGIKLKELLIQLKQL